MTAFSKSLLGRIIFTLALVASISVVIGMFAKYGINKKNNGDLGGSNCNITAYKAVIHKCTVTETVYHNGGFNNGGFNNGYHNGGSSTRIRKDDCWDIIVRVTYDTGGSQQNSSTVFKKDILDPDSVELLTKNIIGTEYVCYYDVNNSKDVRFDHYDTKVYLIVGSIFAVLTFLIIVLWIVLIVMDW